MKKEHRTAPLQNELHYVDYSRLFCQNVIKIHFYIQPCEKFKSSSFLEHLLICLNAQVHSGQL